MKKVWENPQITVEQFEANEYVAACDDLQNVYYNFVCDAGGGVSGDVWEGSTTNADNTQISGGTNLTNGNPYYSFSACDASHYVLKSEADAKNMFTSGIYHKGITDDSTSVKKYGSVFGYGGTMSELIPVTIWKGENNDDVHCMTNLGVEIETVKGNKS